MAKKEVTDNNQDHKSGDVYKDQLEKRVDELRKENEELVRLKNVEKFAATGRIARTIAHEVRNPLTNISLALEQLGAEMPHNEETVLLMEMINRNTLRINQLITELLDSTKFAQLTFSRLVINDLIDETLEHVKGITDKKRITINKHYDENLREVNADEEKLKTAFENIIVNAAEAMHADEGVLTITTAEESGKCVITFRDNGIGVSEEKIARLFEPYFTSKMKGSGLGLTHTQNIILNHGGNIHIESELGKGTSFIIVLDFA